MGITRSDLDSFHRFATGRVDSGRTDLTFAELYGMWRIENPGPDELAESVAAIKGAIRDMEDGDRGIPLEDHIRQMREKYKVPADE